MKQETLEEAAENHKEDITDAWSINDHCKSSFIEGAEWQQEMSYSEREVLRFLKDALANYALRNNRIELKEWFNQFKKK